MCCYLEADHIITGLLLILLLLYTKEKIIRLCGICSSMVNNHYFKYLKGGKIANPVLFFFKENHLKFKHPTSPRKIN